MRIRPGDIIIALFVAAVSVFLLLYHPAAASGELVAVVTLDGEEVERIELREGMDPVVVSLEDVGVTITAENAEIAFTYSDCPDQTCVHTGWLKNAGDIAVCIPNGVVVKIEGARSSDIDTIAE